MFKNFKFLPQKNYLKLTGTSQNDFHQAVAVAEVKDCSVNLLDIQMPLDMIGFTKL